MNHQELRYQIGVTLIKGIGPVNARKLISYLGSVEAVFTEKPELLKKIPGIGEVLANAISTQQVLKRADAEIEFIERYKIHTHFFTESSYPYRLKECEDAPVLIYSKGTDDFNTGRYLAVVGTRKITPYGKELCQSIIQSLAQTQPELTIVSGLAYGVDVAAHKAAIDNDLRTFSVVAHGLDRIYPSTHQSVAKKIIEMGGSIITEYPSQTNPDAPNFVERNRIVAGMCDATLVIESGLKGGSLITAELANGYNRDVFAIPGRISDTQSQGCNNLIYKNQAVLIQTASDLEKFMNWDTQLNTRTVQQKLFTSLTSDEEQIINVLRAEDSVYINALATKSKIPLQKLLGLLIQLEFKGLIHSLPGSHYKIVS